MLYECLEPPIALLACGDGPDVTPLLGLVAQLGWHARGVRKDDALGAIDPRTAAVVMTHNYARDLELLAALLASPAGYVGVLGPRTRRRHMSFAIPNGDGTHREVCLDKLEFNSDGTILPVKTTR